MAKACNTKKQHKAKHYSPMNQSGASYSKNQTNESVRKGYKPSKFCHWSRCHRCCRFEFAAQRGATEDVEIQVAVSATHQEKGKDDGRLQTKKQGGK